MTDRHPSTVMTVRKLRDALAGLNPDLPVVHRGHEYGHEYTGAPVVVEMVYNDAPWWHGPWEKDEDEDEDRAETVVCLPVGARRPKSEGGL